MGEILFKKTSEDPYVHGNFFSRLYYGEYSLVVTYWLYGLVVSMAINLSLDKVVYALGRPRGGVVFFSPEYKFPVEFFLQVCLESGFAIVGVAVTLLVYAYSYIQAVGQWRSARKYTGPKFWAIVAMIFSLRTIGIIAVDIYYYASSIIENAF